jgi:O-antigen ligase
VWEGHKSLAYRGWDTVFQDAALGLDIDGNKQWQKGEGTVPMPINSSGVPAAMNTYSRFAWAAVGAQLISQYPLGYGSINRSFKGLQEQAEIPHEHGGQVHSGWIDFGLAFGIPGLLLIFSSILAIIYFGLKSKSSIALPWVIFCFALMPFGLIAEIAYKQYFEATIFFLTLASTVIIFGRGNWNVGFLNE